MAELKRITAEEVLEAYRVTGLKPERDISILKVDGRWCGCAMMAFAIVKKVVQLQRMKCAGAADMEMLNAMQASGFHVKYLIGFARGFDGKRQSKCCKERRLGYSDGRAAAQAVFAEGE